MSELRVDNIVSQDGSAAPVYSKGIRVAAGQTMTVEGDLTVTGETTISGVTTYSSGFNVAGVVTATSFIGDITGSVTGNITGNVTGNVTGTATTATNLADGANITTGTISDDRLPDLITSNINIASGISSVATLDSTNATIDNLTFTSGTAITSVDTDLTAVSGSDDTLASAKAIKTYVDAQITAEDLDFAGDSGTGAVDLDSQSLTISGTASEIETSASGQTLSIGLPNQVAITTSLTVGSATTINSDGVNATGIITATGGFNIGISSAGSSITSGPVTTLNFIGAGNTFAVDGTTVDISIAGGGGGGGAGGDGTDFNTGISSAVYKKAVGIGSTVLELPATAGKQYLIYSIHASNVATGNTEVNVIGSFDYNGGERSYFGYNIPIPTGTAVELLKQPHVLNPSDKIVMRSTDYSRAGADDIVQVYITYEEKTSTDYIGVGLGTVGIAVTTAVAIHTATTYPSIIQSINLANRTDAGGYPVSVRVTSGLVTTYLVDNLIIPKYAAVELLDEPKRMNINDVLEIEVDQTSTIDVQVSGKKVTS